jgi:predicted HicB family RNase H-like nuclease
MSLMEYKGYLASIQYHEGDDTFIGHVINTQRDRFVFHGDSPKELRKHFKELIDFYLEDKEHVERPYSGRVTYRIDPAFHADLARAASLSGKHSINAFMTEILSKSVASVLEKRT